MIDYEEMILDSVDVDSTADDCTVCPYKGRCNSQCMDVVEVYNSVLEVQR